jgi:hypothetical protein
MTKTKPKLTKAKAASLLAAIAEKHLSTMPADEQTRRVAAFSRRKFKNGHESRAKSSASSETRVYPVVARGR